MELSYYVVSSNTYQVASTFPAKRSLGYTFSVAVLYAISLYGSLLTVTLAECDIGLSIGKYKIYY